METIVSDVFGVNEKIVLSTINRTEIDKEIERTLSENKHIVLYGASKQGKTYLRKKCIPPEECVIFDCGPASTIRDIYTSIARQQDVQIIKTRKYGSSHISSVSAKIKGGIKLPFIASGDVEAGGKVGVNDDQSEESVPLEYNLNHAQDLCELLKRYNLNKRIVLENFHYLRENAQVTLAFDLRTFADQGFQFVILGVWRDQNRLTQYNGDLLGRIVEISVEPWGDDEFDNVIKKGEEALNIVFEDQLIQEIKDECFNSIGIFQELCKRICIENGVEVRQESSVKIHDKELFKRAIQYELKKYGQRHIKSFRALVSKGKSQTKEGPTVAYLVVKAFLDSKFKNIRNGIRRDQLEEKIDEIRGDMKMPTRSELGGFLHDILRYQNTRAINPPLFDYDEVERVLIVIDSTLFFYLKHNKDKIVNEVVEAVEED